MTVKVEGAQLKAPARCRRLYRINHRRIIVGNEGKGLTMLLLFGEERSVGNDSGEQPETPPQNATSRHLDRHTMVRNADHPL